MTWTPSKHATEAAAKRLANSANDRFHGSMPWAEYSDEMKASMVILMHDALVAAHDAEVAEAAKNEPHAAHAAHME